MVTKKGPAVVKKNESSKKMWYSLAIARILLGLLFVWAFFDKLFGLGYATPAARAWVNGGSPTAGFLKNVEGPFADLFNAMAGHAWADWLFMAGLLGIGVALVFGVAVRIAAMTGSLLLFMMWMASLPLENNPVIDDHIVYIPLLLAIAFMPTQVVSMQSAWRALPVVKQNRWLW